MEKLKNSIIDSFQEILKIRGQFHLPVTRDMAINVRWPTQGKAICFLRANLGVLEINRVRHLKSNPRRLTLEERHQKKGWSQIRTWENHKWSTGELTTTSLVPNNKVLKEWSKSNPEEKYFNIYNSYALNSDMKYAGQSLSCQK